MVNWGITMQPVRLFGMDARSMLGFLLWAFTLKWWSFWVAIVCVTLFWVLERKGLTLPASFRALRAWLSRWNTPYRPAISLRRYRHMRDREY